MPIVEWENVTLLVTLQGSLDLNAQTADGLYVVKNNADGADSGTDIRSTGDPVPQGDGTIWHRGFPNGYQVKLAIEYWADDKTPACETSSPTAQAMDDLLMRHLRSILSGGGRLFYNPAGMNRRLLDSLRVISKIDVQEAPGQVAAVVTLGSEFPYLIDFEQNDDVIDTGSPTITLTNGGSAPYFPVFQVYGAFSDFILSNLTTGKEIVYDAGLPGAVSVGGGDYIEINTFQNTVYLNGSGASRKAGIDIIDSEFWTLEVGANNLQITSSGTAPTTHILWQDAWF